MGILEPERTDTGPHPRKEPRFDGPLTLESLGRVFEGCVDYMERQVYLHGDRERTVTVCYLLGMTRNERLSDYILRPLAQDPALSRAPEEELFSLLQYGALYNLAANRRTALEDVVNDLILGSCALFFPGRADVLTLPVPTEEKRSVGEPENEPALKGVRESFVESIRTNTAMVRRHLKAPELKIREHIVGRRSRTQVDVLYLEGIADPETVERLRRRLDNIDIDGVEAAGNLEEYLVDHLNTPFPTMPYTQRPDRFCQGLLEGRVGLMADGLPFAWMLPGTIDQFFKTGQDRAFHWMTASVLNLVRWFCALVTVLLPGLYIAVVTFHPEAIPVKLALSIVAAKQEVLSEAFEQALEKLCALPEEEYIQLLTGMVLQAVSTGREQLVFSPRDRSRIGKQVVVAANEALVKAVAPELPDSLTDSRVGALLGKVVNSAAAQITGTGLLSLAEETRPIRGGFILVDGPVEVNCSFETLVRLQREKLENQAAELLFGN